MIYIAVSSHNGLSTGALQTGEGTPVLATNITTLYASFNRHGLVYPR